MAYKPGDFFLGTIDFFGILVPGAVVTLMHGNWVLEKLGGQLTNYSSSVQWVMFLVASYIVGHFLLAAGVPLNRLLGVIFPPKKDRYYQDAKDLIELPSGVKDERRDKFYRAYSFVRLNSSAATGEIERNMAEFKLFRSLAVASLLYFPLAFVCGVLDWTRVLLELLVFLSALARFLFLLKWTSRTKLNS